MVIFHSFTRKFYHYDWKDFDYLLLTSLQNQSFETFKMLLSNEVLYINDQLL